MESKVIPQNKNPRLVVNYDYEFDSVILLQNTADRHNIDRIVIETESIPDLIAALQSFLPKEG